MSKYFVEYGALQANARRLIECDTSALPPKKITEAFAREIADALNSHEPGASLDFHPTDSDLKELYRKQSAALASTARKIADMDPTGKFSSLDVHNYSGSAPVVIQIFATCPGTDLGGSATLR